MIFSIMIGFIEDTKKSYSHKLTFFVTITSKLILSQRHLVSHVFSSHTSDDDLMTESEPDNSPPLRLWPRSRSQWQPVTPALYRWLGWSPAQAAWLWLNTDYLIPACPANRAPDTHRPAIIRPHGPEHPMRQESASWRRKFHEHQAKNAMKQSCSILI